VTVIHFGQGEPNTILSGVKELIQVGMWPVALLVFFASITVPVLKLIGLTFLLITVQRCRGGQRLELAPDLGQLTLLRRLEGGLLRRDRDCSACCGGHNPPSER
jgi:hypothetical protein